MAESWDSFGEFPIWWIFLDSKNKMGIEVFKRFGLEMV